MQTVRDEYDSAPYLDYVHPLCHPSRLATLARLLGYPFVADPDAARVLDLGCGQGLNLATFAAQHPAARCLGLDFCAPHVAAAEALAQDGGLTNVRFLHQDLTDWCPGADRFDFILCYGVFSWVPAETRAAILRILRQALAPGGIACVSYLTLPGSAPSVALRELLLTEAGALPAPRKKVVRATEVLEFLDAAWESQSAGVHSGAWRAAARAMLDKDPNLLLHDDLATVRQPFYLLEFVEQLKANGLHYLGDGELGSMFPDRLPAVLAERIARLGLDPLRTEQWLDYAWNRTFRISLVAREPAPGTCRLDPDAVRELCVGTDLIPPVRPGASRHTEEFGTRSGGTVVLQGEAWVAFAREMARHPGCLVPFREIQAATEAGLGRAFEAGEIQRIATEVLYQFGRRRFHLDAAPFRVPQDLPDRPRLSDFNRALARRRAKVASIRHRALPLSPGEAEFARELDGTRTLDQLRATAPGRALGGQAMSMLRRLLAEGCLSEGR